MKEAFKRVKSALLREKNNSINNSLKAFIEDLEAIAEETIISLDVCSKYTREAIKDIRTM
jgi:hypothetical protein